MFQRLACIVDELGTLLPHVTEPASEGLLLRAIYVLTVLCEELALALPVEDSA